MDLDMPYCCSDCDIGIKIGKLGLENWVVASSVAYHRGSSSAQNGKSSSFSYLRNDSTNMFWAKIIIMFIIVSEILYPLLSNI